MDLARRLVLASPASQGDLAVGEARPISLTAALVWRLGA